MAITLTGAKYSAASISSVGTTTVTVGTTPFVSGDFNTARRVDLFDSTGATFKGFAFVRAYQSTSVLQLETEFFNPKTGATVSQTSGDLVYVSKNWADVVQAGISISNNVVTVSDTITFGTASDPDSLSFHDEGKYVVNTVTTANAKFYDVAGGVITFGHLQDYASKSTYGGVHFYFATTNKGNSFVATSTSARMCLFGGTHNGSGSNPLYFCSGSSTSSYGTDWAHFWGLNFACDATDVLSKSAGGNWTTGSDHVLESCTFTGAGTNQILTRFGNGSILGGQWKVPRNSASPLAIFGSDTDGTYALGAPAGSRAVVRDIGSGNHLWRAVSAASQTINCTNLICSAYSAMWGSSDPLTSNSNATVNVYFSDNYTNLRDTSVVGIIRDSDWSFDSSGSASGSAATVAGIAFRSTATGNGSHTSRGPWTYRIRKYGYDELEGAISETSYSLGTAGSAPQVAFGGYVNQIARSSLTDSEATALAYTGITVTDHGASPVSWQSKTWSITVTVDLGTYPSRTAAQVFAHIKAGIAKTTTWNGKAGLLWHVLMEESGSGYVSQRGKSGGAGATLKGVRIINHLGAALNGVTSMTADDGSILAIPDVVYQSVTLSGVLTGSRVQIYDTTNDEELFNDTTGYAWTDSVAAAGTRDIRVRIAWVSSDTAMEFLEANIGTCGITDGTEAVAYLVSQVSDTTYDNNGIIGSAVTGVTFTDAATDIINIDVAANAITWPQIYAAFCYWIFTAAGIADDIAYIQAKDTANYTLTSMKIKNTSSPSDPLVVSGGYGVDASTGTSLPLVDTSGGTLIFAPDHVVAYQTSGTYAITGDISTVLAAIPSATANAAATLAAAQDEPIHSRVKIINDTTLAGSGASGDPMRPA